jgi:molybdenum cofactor synthesis domain-containing protein
MQVALLTVGDELLAGDTENTNASWLARRLTARGVTVARILVVPDDEALIAETLREWSRAFDAVVVTGGLGGTHDDVTMAAVADAFDRRLVVDGEARENVIETSRAFREANPDLVERYEMEIEFDAWAEVPEGARALVNPAGLSPGCVCENVYVLPGVPEEMRATFELVAEEFGGEGRSETLYTPAPESSLRPHAEDARDRFDVAVGSYPAPSESLNRLKITGTDAAVVREAADWLGDRVHVVDPPEEAGGDADGDGGDAPDDRGDRDGGAAAVDDPE